MEEQMEKSRNDGDRLTDTSDIAKHVYKDNDTAELTNIAESKNAKNKVKHSETSAIKKLKSKRSNNNIKKLSAKQDDEAIDHSETLEEKKNKLSRSRKNSEDSNKLTKNTSCDKNDRTRSKSDVNDNQVKTESLNNKEGRKEADVAENSKNTKADIENLADISDAAKDKHKNNASSSLSKKDKKDTKSSIKDRNKRNNVDQNKQKALKDSSQITECAKSEKAAELLTGAKVKTAVEDTNKDIETSVTKAKDVDIKNNNDEADEPKENIPNSNRLSIQGLGRLEYGTALQVDTSYNTGVSSDSNCSQYSASSWASELDTSSSLDPSPNTWNSYIDSGGAGDQYLDGFPSGGINRAFYSDTSDISGEESGSYDNIIDVGNQADFAYDGNHVQICSRWLKKEHDHSSFNSGRYYLELPSHVNHSLTNGYNSCVARGLLDQNIPNYTSNYESAIGYRTCSDVIDDMSGSDTSIVDGCDYCWYCMCNGYGDGYTKRMMPGDVYYFSSNSVVLCMKQSAKEKDIEVTPKSPGLNPNASVFLSTKTSTPGGPTTQDSVAWDGNDSGINNNSSSEFSYVNGDVSSDKSDAGIFSPTSDSPFQADYNYTDNLTFNDSNMKLENSLGSLSLDNQSLYNTENQVNFVTDTSQPPPDTQFGSENGMPLSQVPSEGSTPAPMAVDGDLSDDQLRQQLKAKLESYFSRENLSNDSYLQSQMDTDQYVPISTVANLDHVQRLTDDLSLIVELLRESTYVQVDEKGEKVRPNHNRCIVILREIPDETPVEEVKELFSGQNCPKFVNCEFAHNSNWYVTFDSDADAQVAYKYLREEVRTFKGKPIMARIKAKPLIRTYDPRNGYKRMAPPPQTSGQITNEVITSSSQPPQFTATPPFSLMPNPQMSQYHLNGQQAIPFYPPNILQPNWPAPNPAMLDPSMVLQMNGYQATSIKVNNPVPNRTPYTNVNRNNNSRNQKVMNNQHQHQHSHRDRLNSNESVPPRFLNQHERQQMQNNANNNNLHKTSPRNPDITPISNHMSGYQGRRMESGGSGGGYNNHSNHGSHSNHGNHGGHPHSAHGPHAPAHHHHHHHHAQHMDYNANHSYSSSNGAGMTRPPHPGDPAQRYAGRSYKSRRRREEDGARLVRSNSSQSAPREGGTQSVSHSRHSSVDKQFDYEPTSFPPLPGSGSNTASGEVFESMLSDVVKGTAKGKEIPRSTSTLSTSPTTTTITSAVTTVTSSTHVTPPAASRETTKDPGSNTSVSNASSVTSSASTVPTSSSTSVGKFAPQQPKSSYSSGTAVQNTQPVSNPVRSSPGSGQKPASTVAADSKPSSDKQQTTVQTNSKDEAETSTPSSLVKLSYAQMVQRTKVAEVSANSITDKSDSSDSEGGADTPLQQSNKPNQPSVQSNANKPSSSNSRAPTKDFPRKDGRDSDREFREDTRKDNDYRRDEPREQRVNNRRSLKENRERRFGDRDNARKFERRDRDGPPREREGARTAVAK